MATLNVRYQEYPPPRRAWRRSAGLTFRQVSVEGPAEAFAVLAEHIADAHDSDEPVTSEVDADGVAGTLVVAQSLEGLELVHLNRGLVIAGDRAVLADLQAAAKALAAGDATARDFEGTTGTALTRDQSRGCRSRSSSR